MGSRWNQESDTTNVDDETPIGETRSLWRQGRIYGVGNLLDRVAAFLMIPVLVHALTPDEWGVYTLTVVVGQLLMVLPAGILDPFIRLYFDYDDAIERNRVVSTAFGLLLGFGVLLAALALPLAVGTTELLFGNQEHMRAFLIANLAVVFALLFQVELDYLRLIRRPGLFVGSTLLRSVAHLGLSIYLVLVARQGVVGIVLANLIATATVSLPLAGSVLSRIGLGLRASTARELFRLGLPLAPAWVAKSFLEAVERTLLYQLTSTSALGLFSVASKLADQLRSLITRPVANVWGVRVMEVGDSQPQMTNLHRVLIYITAAVAAAAVPLGLFGPEILRLMAGESFLGAAPILPVLALAQLVEPLNVHFEFVLLQRKKTTYLPLINWATLAVSIAALILLVPKHGLIGAAFAVAAAQVARLAASAMLARRCSESARMVSWTSYATILLLAASASGSGVALASGNPGPVDIAIKSGLCVVFLTALLLGPTFTSTERRTLASYFRSRLAGWPPR